ncbi:solute carrier family 46 member 3-like [Portunus trituberculatus]|uniref:solute carrier family 46 member 3-like n=1 Tax=Portunus trituberculatus TaxID=210409 RepID=UPI001E1CD8A7|nr:solute carrier family 46 member 3-like [Portunus trituberculatus]XP_045102827.1 solute carrier family 46 member 3-like [Portunus trituberculatus]
MPAVSESTPLLRNPPVKPQPCSRSSFTRALSLVTVEPALFLEAVAYGVNENLLTNLTVDKLCSVHFNYDAETCSNLDAGNHTAQQDQVQRLASDYIMYNKWVEYVPALLTNLLLGSLGDARGRRLPVLLTFIGHLMMAACYLANTYWWRLPVSLICLSALPMGLFGGHVGISNAVNAYLSSSSESRSRTTSLSSVEWVKYAAHPLGVYASSLLYAHGGYVLAFSFYVLLLLASVLYVLLCVGEPPVPPGSTKLGMAAHIRSTFEVPVKIRRSGRRGMVMAAYTAVVMLWCFARETKVQFFLYERKVFGWQLQQYADWLVFSYLVKAAGLLLVVPACSYYLGVQDAMLGFIGGVSMMFFYTVFATAPEPWVLYIAAVLSLCSAVPVVTSRGAISKIVASNDLGTTFAFLALLECLAVLLGTSLYTSIYNLTLDIFPGTLYLVMAGVGAVVCCIHVWLLTNFDENYSRGK